MEGDPLWNIRKLEASAPPPPASEREDSPQNPPEELVQKIRSGLEWSYIREVDTRLPSKLTATELKGGFAAAEANEEAEKLPPRVYTSSLRRPSFTSAYEGLSSAERGTALHLVMQYINFSAAAALLLYAKKLTGLKQ
jgi:ATP-dependent helicase/nuclease subunit A